MTFDPNWRCRARAALERYFERRSYPRTVLTLLLIITGLVAFFASYAMLRAGVDHMWLRYPIAVLIGYGALLALIRLWVEVEFSRFDPEDPLVKGGGETEAVEVHLRRRSDGWSWADCLNVLDFDEGFLPLLLFGAVIVLAVALSTAIVAAPLLIAEVFIDAFIVTVLYRRLRTAQKENWLGTALRRTWVPALLVALALSAGGWALEQMAPGSRSAGKALKELFKTAG